MSRAERKFWRTARRELIDEQRAGMPWWCQRTLRVALRQWLIQRMLSSTAPLPNRSTGDGT